MSMPPTDIKADPPVQKAAPPALSPPVRSHPRWSLGAPPPNNDEEAWVLTYIDVLTLLLTLFVVLLAYAKYDDTNYREFTERVPQQMTIERPKPPPSAGELAQSFREDIARGGMEQSVEVIPVADRVELRIKESILFESGRAGLRPEGATVLGQLAGMLQQEGRRIAVEGHTDDVPIATERFPSNWELSAARASSVVRHLIDQGVPPNRLRAVGFADTRPVAGNDTPEGRAKNRRVSLVMSVRPRGGAEE